jgi:hypothetical protein
MRKTPSLHPARIGYPHFAAAFGLKTEAGALLIPRLSVGALALPLRPKAAVAAFWKMGKMLYRGEAGDLEQESWEMGPWGGRRFLPNFVESAADRE